MPVAGTSAGEADPPRIPARRAGAVAREAAGGPAVTGLAAPRSPGRPRPVFHRVTVAEAGHLTPRMGRLVLTGDDLAGYLCDGPGAHLKLVLPPPGQDEVRLPEFTGEGLRWPDGPRPVLRTYTPRIVDWAGRRLTVDFALHPDGGPASTWAAAARPGDQVVVSGARGAYWIQAPTAADGNGARETAGNGPGAGTAADWTLLVADETALPAAGAILQDAPAGARVLLIAEVADAAEHLPLQTAADLTVTWLHRDGTGAAAGELAAEAVRDAALPAGRGAFWAGLEAGAMRAVRTHLVTERGAAREQLHTRAYWKRGVANHPDHDTGDEQ
jgi:NADPH-dependent ferric siderophore reductase